MGLQAGPLLSAGISQIGAVIHTRNGEIEGREYHNFQGCKKLPWSPPTPRRPSAGGGVGGGDGPPPPPRNALGVTSPLGSNSRPFFRIRAQISRPSSVLAVHFSAHVVPRTLFYVKFIAKRAFKKVTPK